MKRFKGILKNKKNRPALESKVDLLAYDTTTTRSFDTDEMTNGWPLTRLSPSHYIGWGDEYCDAIYGQYHKQSSKQCNWRRI